MIPRTLLSLAQACAGELRSASPSHEVHRVTTDSREMRSGDLFVALRGERFDAHDFLGAVAKVPGVAAVVSRARFLQVPIGLPCIVVDDPRQAYARMAAAYRLEFEIPIVCVGGSNGKTTTKELIAAVVGSDRSILKSEASFNNDVGVPATLFRLEAFHRAAVLEAGTNHPGELSPLVRMIAPSIGIITSIGREHLEFFRDLDGVVREEGALAEQLPSANKGGVLILEGATPWSEALSKKTEARVVRIGYAPSNDWMVTLVSMGWSGTRFIVRAPRPDWSGEYFVNLPGRHSVLNALYALTVACELGVEPTAARDGLAAFQPASRRLQVYSIDGVQVLDDTYNANADSMLAALRTLADLPIEGRRVAVLGDMAELGPETPSAHMEVGKAVKELGIDQLLAVGRYASITVKATGRANDLAFDDAETVSRHLIKTLKPGDGLLVKASRSSRLEQVVEILLERAKIYAVSSDKVAH